MSGLLDRKHWVLNTETGKWSLRRNSYNTLNLIERFDERHYIQVLDLRKHDVIKVNIFYEGDLHQCQLKRNFKGWSTETIFEEVVNGFMRITQDKMAILYVHNDISVLSKFAKDMVRECQSNQPS